MERIWSLCDLQRELIQLSENENMRGINRRVVKMGEISVEGMLIDYRAPRNTSKDLLSIVTLVDVSENAGFDTTVKAELMIFDAHPSSFPPVCAVGDIIRVFRVFPQMYLKNTLESSIIQLIWRRRNSQLLYFLNPISIASSSNPVLTPWKFPANAILPWNGSSIHESRIKSQMQRGNEFLISKHRQLLPIYKRVLLTSLNAIHVSAQIGSKSCFNFIAKLTHIRKPLYTQSSKGPYVLQLEIWDGSHWNTDSRKYQSGDNAFVMVSKGAFERQRLLQSMKHPLIQELQQTTQRASRYQADLDVESSVVWIGFRELQFEFEETETGIHRGVFTFVNDSSMYILPNICREVQYVVSNFCNSLLCEFPSQHTPLLEHAAALGGNEATNLDANSNQRISIGTTFEDTGGIILDASFETQIKSKTFNEQQRVPLIPIHNALDSRIGDKSIRIFRILARPMTISKCSIGSQAAFVLRVVDATSMMTVYITKSSLKDEDQQEQKLVEYMMKFDQWMELGIISLPMSEGSNRFYLLTQLEIRAQHLI